MPIDSVTASLLIAAAKACIAKAGALNLTGHHAMLCIIHKLVPAHIVAGIQEIFGPHGIVQAIFGHHALAAAPGFRAAGHSNCNVATILQLPAFGSVVSHSGPPSHQYTPASNIFPPIRTPQYTDHAPSPSPFPSSSPS